MHMMSILGIGIVVMRGKSSALSDGKRFPSLLYLNVDEEQFYQSFC